MIWIFFFNEGTCQEDVERIGVVNFCFKISKKKKEITERKRYESKKNSGKQRGREKANNKGKQKNHKRKKESHRKMDLFRLTPQQCIIEKRLVKKD